MTWKRGLGSLTVVVASAVGLLPGTAAPAQQPPPAPRFDTEMTRTPPRPAATTAYRNAAPGGVQPTAAHATDPQELRRLPSPDPRPGDPGALGRPPYNVDPSQSPPPPVSRVPPAQAPAPPDAGPPVSSSELPDGPAPELFAPGKIIAWVGNQPIQSGDLMPSIELALATALEKMSPREIETHRHEIEQQKQQMLRQALGSAVDAKLLYLDFLRSLPNDKRAEALANITKRAEAEFYDQQMPNMLERANVESIIEWEAELRKYGSSVAEQRRLFVERILGQSVLSQKIDYRPEVTHQELLDRYQENIEEYRLPARARWEKLTVRHNRFSSRAEAWAALAHMGNEVLRGAPLSAVAKRHSQDVDASNGGYHDWTTRGSLASETLDRAIFSLPVGRLSERLEDDRGFHIVRVIERREAGKVPFLEAQVDIRETLREEKTRAQIQEYVEKLRSEITVWTVFDDEAPSPGSPPDRAATSENGMPAGRRGA